MDQLSLLGGSPVASTVRRRSAKPRKPSRDATSCERCGVALAPRARSSGKPRKYCAECAQIMRRGFKLQRKGPVTKACAGCGIEIVGRADKRWCSTECSYKHRYEPQERPTHCLRCGKELPPSQPGGIRKWCSRACATKREKPFKLTVVQWEPPPPPRRWVAGYCAECRDPFVSNQPQAKYCSDRCCRRRSERHKAQRRAARKHGNGNIEAIDIRKIAERDSWTCHLCRQPVTRETWSLDHLLPLSLGGDHTADNVALAHRLCNAVRGALPLKETQATTIATLAALKDAA